MSKPQRYSHREKTFGRLAFLLLSAVMLSATGCVDEVYNQAVENVTEYAPDENGMYGPFSLTIPLDAGGYEVVARSTFDTDNFEISSSWVAMFDATTGRLVSMTMRDNITGNPNASDHAGGVGGDYTVTLDNLMFNDENSKVYIAGVVNYENIDAFDAHGNSMPLIEALKNIKTIKDYKNISVSSNSADVASRGNDQTNRPLMAGFWGAGHSNFTVDLSGKVHTNTSGSATTAEVQLFDTTTKKVTDSFKNTITGGKIHLRRLFSHVQVTATVDMTKFDTFDVMGIEVCNVPEYTFIQEHKTVEDASKYTYVTWVDSVSTHTAADLFGEAGYKNYELPSSGDLKTGSFACYGADDLWKESTSGNTKTLKFGYWHYEQKHWGLSNVKSLNDRERMFEDGSMVYSSLCSTPEKDFNNKATYFVIKAKVRSKDGKYHGDARFVVHEGYACKADGDASTDLAVVSRDFSTFRNTKYTYTVNIGGMEDVTLKVTAGDLSGDFNHGTGGELIGTETRNARVSKEGADIRLRIPEGRLVWCIRDNVEGKSFGVNMQNDWDIAELFPSYPANVDENIPSDNPFYNSITINEQSLGDYVSKSADEECIVRFPYNNNNNSTLYLCCILGSPDKTTSIYTVYAITQNGLVLDTPEVTMPNAPPGNEVILGIHDHTIRIKKVDGATSYQIRLVPVSDGNGGTVGGYSVNLAPGAVNRDDDDYETTLVDEGDYMTYRIRYSNKRNAMMNLVSIKQKQQGTIEVTALGENGQESEPVTITKTFVNPDWHFNNTEWRQAVLGFLGTQAGSFQGKTADLKVNGLTMYSHDDSKMSYQQNGDWYDFKPGGSGSRTRCGFKFHACAVGKINVWVSSISSSSNNLNVGRYIRVWYDGYSQNGRPESDGYYSGYYQHGEDCTSVAPGPGNATQQANGTKPLKTKDISVDPVNLAGDEDNVYIFNSADFLFYHIQFTPQDR